MSASSSGDGSSSTTMAMFCMASRNRRGMDASASATHRSNAARVMFLLDLLYLRGFTIARAGDDETEVVAVVAYDALIAERLRLSDAAPLEDERGRRPRPAVLPPPGG